MAKKSGRKSRRGNSQGTVYERENGSYAWQVTLGFGIDGKQIRKSGTAPTKTEAATALAKAVADHDRGRLAMPDRVTMGEWLDRWLEHRKPRLSPNSHASYQGLIDRHIKPYVGGHRLQGLLPIHLRQFYATLAARADEKGNTLAPRTLRYVHGLVYSALKDAMRLEIVGRNVAELVRPETVAGDRNARASQAWTAEEVAAFLEVAERDPLYPVFYLMLALGPRRGEVLGLRWEHVDLERRRLRIVETLVLVEGRVLPSKPKTRRSARTLRLPGDVAAVLGAHHSRQAATLAELGVRPERDWVFTTATGSPIRPDNLDRSLKRLARAAGVRGVRVHDLRHTYASLARRSGVSLEVVSEKLGHSRPSFTADVYRHTFEDEHEEATLDLRQLIAGKGDGGGGGEGPPPAAPAGDEDDPEPGPAPRE